MKLWPQTMINLRDIFTYTNGVLFWKRRGGGTKRLLAGYQNKKDGRWRIGLNGKLYLRSRLIWAWHNGEFSTDEIDHINLDVSDDRIENLRLATRIENGRNRHKQKNNTSGYRGVCHVKNRKSPWRADITVHGKQKCLGYYQSAAKAGEAYKQAAKRYFGDFSPMDMEN